MRTTVTLDDDIARRLQEAMRERGQPFKQVLNEALRRGLAAEPGRGGGAFRVEARPLRLRPGVDPSRLHDLDAELEVDRFRETTRLLVERSGSS